MKYKNIKSKNFDSKFEVRYYLQTLRPLEKAGKISQLKRLERKDGIELVKGFKIRKNGKISKQQSIKMTPDFFFYNKAKTFPLLPINKKVYCELKQVETEKKTDYRMRRRLFVNALDEDTVFLEVVSNNGRLTFVVWEKI